MATGSKTRSSLPSGRRIFNCATQSRMPVLDRFLRYAAIDTRADEASRTCPSTPGQLVLLRLLAAELRGVGLADVTLDDNGYVMATVPATTTGDVPVIGFVAHVDTSPEM